MPDLTIEHSANCSVFLVPQFDDPESVIFILTNATSRFLKPNWPAGTSIKANGARHEPEGFWEFFDTEIHDMVLDMEEAELNITPVFDNMM